MVRATTVTRIDDSTDPKQIDLKLSSISLSVIAGQLHADGAKIEDIRESLKDGKMKGIYRLNGNKLVYCLAAPGKPRPTSFEVMKDSGQTLVTLEPFSTGEKAIEAKLAKLGAGFRKDDIGWIIALNFQQEKIDKAAYVHIAKLSHLQTVYIASDSFTDANLAELTSMMSLRTLEIKSKSITDAGLVHIGNMTNLRSLYLLEMPVTDKGLEQLTELTNLMTLRLRGTKVTDDGLKVLASLKRLEKVGLQRMTVTDAGLRYVYILPSLRWVELNDSTITDADVKQLVSAQPQLTMLNLSGTHVTNDAMQHLNTLKKLEWLILDDTAITDAGLDDLHNLNELEKLSLKNTAVTKTATRELKQKLPRLLGIEIAADFKRRPNGGGHKAPPDDPAKKDPGDGDKENDNSKNKPSRKGLEFLAPYPKLRELSLDMTEKQFLTIVKREKLSVRKTSSGPSYWIATDDDHTVIVMFGNNGDKCSGIQRIRGTDKIGEPVRLDSLPDDEESAPKEKGNTSPPSVEPTPPTEDEARAAFQKGKIYVQIQSSKDPFFRFGPEGEFLRLSFSGTKVTDEWMKYLTAFPKTTSLSFSESTQITDASLKIIGQLRDLQSLRLASSQIKGSGLSHLANCSKLARLRIKSRKLTDMELSRLESLAKLPLVELEIGGWQSSDLGLSEVGKLKSLESLTLNVGQNAEGGALVTGRTLRELATLENLKSLEIMGDDIRLHAALRDDDLRVLGKLSKLESLTLSSRLLTDAALKHIGSCKDLTQLTLWHSPITDDGLKHLARLAKLRSIQLFGTKITGTGFKFLRHAEDEASSLTQLSLMGVSATNAGLAEIANLSNLSSLRIGPYGWFDKDATGPLAVTDMGLENLAALKNLTSLDVIMFQVTDAGLEKLKGCSKLRRLGLAKVTVTDEGLAKLGGFEDLYSL